MMNFSDLYSKLENISMRISGKGFWFEYRDLFFHENINVHCNICSKIIHTFNKYEPQNNLHIIYNHGIEHLKKLKVFE